MQVGFLTAPFGNESLEYTVKFAAKAGFGALEVAAGPGSSHIDTANLSDSDAAAIRKLFDDNGIGISSLAWYGDAMNPGQRPGIINIYKGIVDAAEKVGVEVVCTLAGMPVEGKTREQTIQQDCKEVFTQVADYAQGKGIKIALENWFATNMQNLSHWDLMFQAIPNENFGLNFDPSHLVHQGIDYLWAVEHFKSRIFHTHAKDTEIREHIRRYVGVLSGGWWRYVIPGCGVIDWGQYISQLRVNGYNGILSIEHEDGSVGREQGMEMGIRHLSQFI